MDETAANEHDIDLSGSAGSKEPTTPRVGVLVNRFGHLRAGWRMLAYVIAVLVLGMILPAIVKLLVPGADNAPMMSWPNIIMMATVNLLLILAGLIVLKKMDQRPTGMLGLGFQPRWLVELTVGLGAGIISTGGLTLVLVLTGAVSLGLSPSIADAIAVFPIYLAVFTVAAAAEELLFRGYLLQALAEGSRQWLAAILLSLPFTIAHFGNPDVSVIGVVNIFLVGIVIAVLYFQTRRLWLPIGFHISWNFAHGWLWGFDVSGIALENQLLVATPRGPEILTGGGFGLEGSIVTTALVVVALIWLLMKPVLTPTAEVAELWSSYPAGFGIAPVAESRPQTDEPVESVKNAVVAAESGEDVGDQ
jgi:membrane protease YdiL (CAAX protease family)